MGVYGEDVSSTFQGRGAVLIELFRVSSRGTVLDGRRSIVGLPNGWLSVSGEDSLSNTNGTSSIV